MSVSVWEEASLTQLEGLPQGVGVLCKACCTGQETATWGVLKPLGLLYKWVRVLRSCVQVWASTAGPAVLGVLKPLL